MCDVKDPTLLRRVAYCYIYNEIRLAVRRCNIHTYGWLKDRPNNVMKVSDL